MKNTSNSLAAYSSQEAAAACGNLYLLPILAAQRFRELQGGDHPRVNTTAGLKVTALQEIEAGCFAFQNVVGSYAK